VIAQVPHIAGGHRPPLQFWFVCLWRHRGV